ncbi:hypothetical protein A2960_03010 [Candidatus Gottesmanbacteria bacterium RIFCSPLOWO2_01_FULL_39_12b]|uniref:Uncharacterized protein n=1 Tax=Candidatus Gottesmanbacteria bacterium RIFCSPLOWO2_01_FULL_39_12b TaxID=1798388 RepID=A0A1F6AQX8_9BACT|nr:MAG: hypothetical protein A2960_03010 [Candidatus Gottesmanbacteria bacterium RIFCSPLOWO2_01_FULL_39_12b]
MNFYKLRNIIIIATVIFLLFFLWLLFSLFSKKTEEPSELTPTLIPYPTLYKRAIPSVFTPDTSGNKIKISDTWVNNFYETGRKIEDGNDVVIKENSNYKLIYQNPFKLFIVNVLSSPFEKVRAEAEEEFIKSLGITRVESCRLNVRVGTPFFANPEYAKKSYPLSFCEVGVKSGSGL